MAEHPRSARHVGVLHSAGILRARTSPSHGENRGSSPLGSASKIKYLFQDGRLVSNNCPINVYRQRWTSSRGSPHIHISHCVRRSFLA
jgi:hypothetical protein